jgi:hypothetical protein
LGFETRPHETKTKLVIENHEELVEFFLGLKTVEVTELRTFETRFGVKLPLHEPHFEKGTMRLQPGRADECLITVRENALSTPAIFKGEIFVPAIPKLLKDQIKFLVKTKLFQFLIDHRRIALSMDKEAGSSLFTIDDWINFLRMHVAFCNGIGSITITPSKLPSSSFPISKFTGNLDRTASTYLLKAFEGAQSLFRLAGAIEPMVQFEGVATLASDIIELNKLFSGESDISPIGFTTECPEGAILPVKSEMLFANFISIGGITLAYYRTTEMIADREADKLNWKSSSINPREIVVLQNFPSDYQEFVDRAKAKSNIENILLAQPSGA